MGVVEVSSSGVAAVVVEGPLWWGGHRAWIACKRVRGEGVGAQRAHGAPGGVVVVVVVSSSGVTAVVVEGPLCWGGRRAWSACKRVRGGGVGAQCARGVPEGVAVVGVPPQWRNSGGGGGLRGHGLMGPIRSLI